MKKLIISALFSLISFISFSQITAYAKFSNNTVSPTVMIFGAKPLSEKIDFTYFAFVQEKWAETYCGLAYSPAKWMNVGLSVGIEQNPALYRLAPSLWIGSGKTSLLLLTEKGDGKDNYWYKATLSYKVSEKLDLGIRTWRYNGIGPVISYKISNDLKMWAMPAYDTESGHKNLMAGIDVRI